MWYDKLQPNGFQAMTCHVLYLLSDVVCGQCNELWLTMLCSVNLITRLFLGSIKKWKQAFQKDTSLVAKSEAHSQVIL